MFRGICLILLSSILSTGVLWADDVESIPFTRSIIPYTGGPQFVKLTERETRVPYIHEIATYHPNKRLFHSGFACGALLLADFDEDGQMDLFVTGGPRANALYLQAGNLSFVNVTSGLGLSAAEGWAAGAALVDIDQDGDLDIYVCYYDMPNALYINQKRETGSLGFQDAAEEYGLDIRDASLLPAFCDYDRDGDLDLFLLTHQYIRDGGRPKSAVQTEQIPGTRKARIAGEAAKYYKLADAPDEQGRWHYLDVGRRDYLLRNDKGKFKSVGKEAGISQDRTVGNSAIWWDYDRDGWPDLYVANDGADPDRLYRNQGDGSFADVTETALPRTPWFSCGAVTLDANGDGLLDLFVGDRVPVSHYKQHLSMPSDRALEELSGPVRQFRRNALYLNTESSALQETASLFGLGATDWTWSIKSGDYDQDGREDLFVTNGAARHFHHADLEEPTHERQVGKTLWDLVEDETEELKERNIAFRNTGDGFEDMSAKWGLDALGMSQTCAQGDLDRDGDLDLVVASLNEPLVIYRNDAATGNAIRIQLRGTKSNIRGVGALVRLEAEGKIQVRQYYPSWGYLDADEPALHFGLGDADYVDRLQITWPSGRIQELRDLKANYTHRITEAETSRPRILQETDPQFTKSGLLDEFRVLPPVEEEEAPPNDLFTEELGDLGPSLAWGDVDGDGDEDLFLGGSAGRPGRILYQQTSRQGNVFYRHWRQWALESHEGSEDMGAVFFDADGDSDLDLYVVSGGIREEAGAEIYRDRLYENRGESQFAPFAKDYLPDLRESGSCVVAADFDRDNDVDLFVGTRSEPGAYSKPCTSRLLVNEDGTFRDGTSEFAPDLEQLGMVTSAVWTDVNDDGWLDLAVALDWGPVVILRNRGTFFERDPVCGTDKHLGRWNSLVAADLDNDGDMDLVAGNQGVNGPLSVSAQTPKLLFGGDMNGDGGFQVVPGTVEGGVGYPLMSYRKSAELMPWIGAQFANHESWARASLPQIFGMDRLRQARLLKVTELRSGMFLNDGSGYFSFHPLPRMAQAASVQGIGVGDFQARGQLDLFLAQNRSSLLPEAEGGQVGGVSLFLERFADATEPDELYQPLGPSESGIAIPRDARSVTVADLNQDLRPDLVVALNEGAPVSYLNAREPKHVPVRMRVQGPPGNREAIGARVTLSVPGMPIQTREIQAGSGYLSASPTRELIFAKPSWLLELIFVEMRWPDGQQVNYTFEASETDLVVKYPKPEPKAEPIEELSSTEG